MTILHYIPSIDEKSGGVGSYMQLISRDLGKKCNLHIVTHPTESELLLENCTVHYIPYKFLPWDNSRVEFLKLLSEIKPDIVHTNCCWMPVSSLVCIWSKKAGYKVIYTPHGMLEPWAIKRNYWAKKLPAILLFQRKGIKTADLIHATAYTEKMNLKKLGWNNNIFVVPNCVQLDKIETKTSWERKKKILFLSRVHPKKGVNFLIEAVAQLKESMKDYIVTVAGPGEENYIKKLKSLAVRFEVDNMFKFVGPVFGDGKWELYKESDLFVLPTYSENFGIVVAESLASGTPVITTKGTPWEELNSNGCGWCTEIGVEPLVYALREFLNCTVFDLSEMGRKGRMLIEDKYTSEAVAEQMLFMYKKLL